MFGPPNDPSGDLRFPIQKRAVVVDSDPLARKRLAEGLSGFGFYVSFADDIQAARQLVSSGGVRFVVVDVASGRQTADVLRILRGAADGVRVVVLTRSASIAMAVHAVQHGAHGYLAKPCLAESVVRSLLRDAWQDDVRAIATHKGCLSLRRMEWEHIQLVLSECGGNLSKAARLLDMPRRTLQRKLLKHPAPEQLFA